MQFISDLRLKNGVNKFDCLNNKKNHGHILKSEIGEPGFYPESHLNLFLL